MKNHRTMSATITFLLLVVTISITLAVSACSKEKPEVEPKEGRAILKKDEKTENKTRDKVRETIREEDIGVIEEFTPELFVAVTILYKKESKKWLEESASLEPESQKRYFDESNVAFFERFGITEDEYINYGKEHADELDKYMEEHPEILSELRNY